MKGILDNTTEALAESTVQKRISDNQRSRSSLEPSYLN
jgi:hypothetical protein